MRSFTPARRSLLCALALAACGAPPTLVVRPLRVINWVPGDGAVCVLPNARVSVTFSDDIVGNSLTRQSFYVQSAAGPLDVAPEYDKLTLTASLTPAAPLDAGRLYTAVLTTKVEGAQDGPLPAKLTSSFQTLPAEGCGAVPRCLHASDCPGTQLCSGIGTCIDACVTERDCPGQSACQSGTCL